MQKLANHKAPKAFDAILLSAHLAALWPIWLWYGARMTDGSDEPWGVAALATAIAVAIIQRRTVQPSHRVRLLWCAYVLTLIYFALMLGGISPLARAMFGVAALACTAIAVLGARDHAPVIVVLSVLSLPLLASLQFYCGYGLRMLTAAMSAAVLQLGGMDVARVGTAMSWRDLTVLVDEPCSGVRMLWTGVFLMCVLWAQQSIVRWRMLIMSIVVVLPIVMIGNALRATALFLVEIYPSVSNSTVHAVIGAMVFAITCGLILGAQVLLARHETRLRRSQNRYATWTPSLAYELDARRGKP